MQFTKRVLVPYVKALFNTITTDFLSFYINKLMKSLPFDILEKIRLYCSFPLLPYPLPPTPAKYNRGYSSARSINCNIIELPITKVWESC